MSPIRSSLVVAALASIPLLSLQGQALPPQPDPALAPFKPPPFTFVENRGQWDEKIRFATRRGDVAACFTDDGAWYAIEKGSSRIVVHQRLVGSKPTRVSPGNDASAPTHFLIGNDAKQWRTDVPTWREVWYRQPIEGVDVRFYDCGGRLEHDVVIADGNRHSNVVWEVDGVDDLSVASNGSLLLRSPLGDLEFSPPVAWVDHPSGPSAVACDFQRVDAHHYGFDIDIPDELAGYPVVIDPGLDVATFLGGISADTATAVGRTTNGSLIITGSTGGYDFPLSPGVISLQIELDYQVSYVVCLNPGATELRWTTMFGGLTGDTTPWDLAVSNEDKIYVAGQTAANDFATGAAGYDTSYGGGGLSGLGDGFLVRLADNGVIDAFTFMGGSADDSILSVAIDPTTRDVIAGGVTFSQTFPLGPNPFQSTFLGTGNFGRDGFVARFDRDLVQLRNATFFGGSANDTISGVAVRRDGSLVVAGQTDSPDLPTSAGCYQPSHQGGDDAFVAIFSPDVSTLVASTYLGGKSLEFHPALAKQTKFGITVAGATFSADFPTTPSAFDTTPNGSLDGYVTRFNSKLTQVVYSTLLGGAQGVTFPTSVAIDGAGQAIVAGDTGASDFPVTAGAYDPVFHGGDPSFPTDMFVSKFSSLGDTLIYSTFIGGIGGDGARDVELLPDGRLLLVGMTYSTDFPTTPNAFQPAQGGAQEPYVGSDGAILILDMLPVGTSSASALGANGVGALDVDRQAHAGGIPLTITAYGLPPSSDGFMAITITSANLSTKTAFSIPATSDALGVARASLPLDHASPGMELDVRFISNRTESAQLHVVLQ